MATVIRSCRNMERSRRSLRRRATPLDCGRPLGSAMKTVNNAKKSTRNLSEPGGGGGGTGCVLRRCLCRYQLKSRSYSTRALDDQQLLAIEGSKKSRGKAGTRRPSGRSAKNPLPHRHRHKVRNPKFSTICSCGISTVFTTVEPARPTQQGHRPLSEVLQLWNHCGLKAHSFLHCLDHRHLSLTTAGMSTTWS